MNLLHAHGSPTDYQYKHKGCRCGPCRLARSENNHSYLDAHPGYDHQRYLENTERYAEHGRKWRRENPEKYLEGLRRFRKKNPRYQREWYAKNPEKGRFYSADWARRNPESVSLYARRRNARKRNATGDHTVTDVLAQRERQKDRCYWCGKRVVGYHVDHVVPLSRGGSNGPENIVIACPACNLKKHATHPMDFAGVMF